MSTSSRHKITVVCPFCRERVNIEELPAHKKEFHVQEMKLPEGALPKMPENTQKGRLGDNSSPDMQSSMGEFTLCPHCTIKLKTSRLRRHIAKVHPKANSNAQPDRVRPGKTFVNPVEPWTKRSGSLERESLEHKISSRESSSKSANVPAKSSEPYKASVTCPFCGMQVPSKKLADHAKTYHAGQNKQSSMSDSKISASFEKVESTKPVVPGTGTYFIDPSGFLLSSKLIREEIKINGDDQPRGVTRGQSTSKGRFAKAKKTKPSVTPTAPVAEEKQQPSRSMDESFREKVEWLNRLSNAIETANRLGTRDFLQCPICKVAVKLKKLKKHIAKVHAGIQLPKEQIENLEKGLSSQDPSQQKRVIKEKRNRERISISKPVDKTDPYQEANLVNCPLCKHRTQYNVLFVHMQVSHPEVNPKVVMSKFNRVNRSKDYANLSRYQDELQELVKDYERLRQGLDEPRDGSKYMGHMRREWNGQFGSFPLHDDYSDEADAE